MYSSNPSGYCCATKCMCHSGTTNVGMRANAARKTSTRLPNVRFVSRTAVICSKMSFMVASFAPAGPTLCRPGTTVCYLTRKYPCISWCRALQKFVQ
jgi:hypothetical protein